MPSIKIHVYHSTVHEVDTSHISKEPLCDKEIINRTSIFIANELAEIDVSRAYVERDDGTIVHLEEKHYNLT